MKRQRLLIVSTLAFLLCVCAFSSCSGKNGKTALRVLIIPKFEIGEMTGDYPGEAQLFYEQYCADCEETEIPGMPPTGHFYVNEENGVGMLVTGSGKTAAGLALMAFLSSDMYDFSDMYIVSVGCGGGNAELCMLGDVILATAACDYDLGHHVDSREREDSSSGITWFPDDSFANYECKQLNTDLCEKVFQMIKDCPLKTTEESKKIISENFENRSEAELIPAVRKGTALSADNFWKGECGHETAKYIAEYYGCADPYAVTEMEEIAVCNTADCFDLLDRVISLRTIVNPDVFLNGATPESTWGEHESFNDKVKDQNDETLDIFEPAMYNLFDTASIIIDAILEGAI